jgi:16S rRNA (guanine527-N7)-methyltransferase
MNDFQGLLLAELATADIRIPLSAEQISLLEGHYQLLTRWNQKINLTSIRSLRESIARHYCECLYFASLLAAEVDRSGADPSISVVDAGSGGGFPGIPVAIYSPGWKVSLVESDARKAVFLREATRGISNVRVVCKRLDRVDGPADWVVSRAVRAADVLAVVPKLSKRVGLLLSTQGAAEVERDARMVWSKRSVIPWGVESVAVFGAFRSVEP